MQGWNQVNRNKQTKNTKHQWSKESFKKIKIDKLLANLTKRWREKIQNTKIRDKGGWGGYYNLENHNDIF